MNFDQYSNDFSSLDPLSKFYRSIQKTIMMLPIFMEMHDGWRRGIKTLPTSIASRWKAGGSKSVLRRIKHYRTLAGASLGAKPPWEQRFVRAEIEHQKLECVSIILHLTASISTTTAKSCIQSLIAQPMKNWKLFVVGAENLQQQKLTSTFHSFVSFKKIQFVESNCCADGFNQALAEVTSDWVMLLEPHCLLKGNSLRDVQVQTHYAGDACWIYPDMIVAGETSRFKKGRLRPVFSPEFLLSQCFLEGLNLVRKSALIEVGGLNRENSEAAMYDLFLRLSENLPVEKILHVPQVWGEIHELLSPHRVAIADHQIAVTESFMRRGIFAKVQSVDHCPHVNEIEFHPSQYPSVNIFISTRNAFDLVKPCIDSIRAKTSYPNYKLIVIDNQSDEPELLEYLECESEADRLAVFQYDRPFNHSEMHNLAVKKFPSDLILLMNNDIELISENWLEQLVASLELAPDLGGVGPMLLYPDDTIQHAGVALGVHRGAGHYFCGLHPSERSYMDRAVSLQGLSACTGALLLLKSSAYQKIHGFNAEEYPASFNDVDLWIRLQNAGYRCLYHPTVKAYHYESKTRPLIPEAERTALRQLQGDWGKYLLSDPFHHPAISIENEFLIGFRTNQEQRDLMHGMNTNASQVSSSFLEKPSSRAA